MPDNDVLLIDSFCERYDLCWCIDTSTIAPIVVGLHDSRIYVFDERLGKLALSFTPDECELGWAATMRKLRQAEFDTVRDCSCEAYAAFDPSNKTQSLLALEIAGICPVADSAAQRATMLDVLQSARQRKAKQRAAKLNTRQRKLAKQGILVDFDELEAALYGAPSQYVCSLKSA